MGITPHHDPEGDKSMPAHVEMRNAFFRKSRACCFYKQAAWPIACDQLSKLLAALPVVLALGICSKFFFYHRFGDSMGMGVLCTGRGGKAPHETLGEGQEELLTEVCRGLEVRGDCSSSDTKGKPCESA